MVLLAVLFPPLTLVETMRSELSKLGLSGGNLNQDYTFKIFENRSGNFAVTRVPDSGAADYIKSLLEVAKAIEVTVLPVGLAGDILDNLS